MSAGQLALLGDSLVGKAGPVPTAEALAGKVVGIYFSAHWCGPCRNFTPQLVKSYEALKATGRPFEIVFASSDRDQGAFDEYYASMPWLALPYAQRELKEKLSSKFKVRGIPTLVLIDADGNTITTDGRSSISSDPQGADFPWKPPTFAEIMNSTQFQKGDGTTASFADALSGKNLALYFSAHWCPPCRAFTPELAKTYRAMKAEAGRADDFEFIFVSADRSQSDFDGYFAEQPWLALPFGNKKANQQLMKHFGVEGFPTVVTVDAAGNTINKDARGAAGSDPSGAEFPWAPKPVNDFAAGPGGINETASLCVLLDACTDEQKAAFETALNPIAVAAQPAPGSDPEMLFFTGKSGGGITDRLRAMCGSPAVQGKASLILLDIPSGGAYYTFDGDTTPESIKTFLDFFKAGALTRKQLS